MAETIQTEPGRLIDTTTLPWDLLEEVPALASPYHFNRGSLREPWRVVRCRIPFFAGAAGQCIVAGVAEGRRIVVVTLPLEKGDVALEDCRRIVREHNADPRWKLNDLLLQGARLVIEKEWSDPDEDFSLSTCPRCQELRPSISQWEPPGGHRDDCPAVAFVLAVAAETGVWP